MTKIAHMIAYTAAKAVYGNFTVFSSGKVLVDIPRLSLLDMTYTIDECGVICHCKHTIKKRNGHLEVLPQTSDELPGWVGEISGNDPILTREPGEGGDWLVWSIDCLIPHVYDQWKNYSGLGFDHFQYHLETQAHIIESNQAFTREWYRMVSAT